MTEKLSVGRFGEQAAAEYMVTEGMVIIKRNFYCRVGEIDIIARDGEYTVFTEVKTRKGKDYGTAGEFVDFKKQGRIIKTALYYCGTEDIAMRFDVAEVYYRQTKQGYIVESINYIKNAF